MNRPEKARSLFTSGLNCSQSILIAFGPAYGLSEDTCRHIARPFGAGMGYMQKTCGAVTGAYMVIGLAHGNYDAEKAGAKEEMFGIMARFNSAFTAQYGSLSCRQLLGCDITTPEGLEKAREENIFYEKCPRFVEGAATILEEIL